VGYDRFRSIDRFDDRHHFAAGTAGGLNHLDVEPAPAAFASDLYDPLRGGPTHFRFFHHDAGWQLLHARQQGAQIGRILGFGATDRLHRLRMIDARRRRLSLAEILHHTPERARLDLLTFHAHYAPCAGGVA